MDEAVQRKVKFAEAMSEDNKWLTLMKSVSGATMLYELTHAFISAVYIYDLDNIEIVWKFKDFLTTSEGEAK